MQILAIETSCDETAAAIIEWSGVQATVLANTVSSQASLHAAWGGVVPDLASREHIRNIVPVIEETLASAKIGPHEIDLIAVTEGPGLIPALLIGVSAAKTLAFIWQKPLIGIHHIEGHIYANFIGNNQSPKANNQKDTFPLIALVVSGGHTQLVFMRDHCQYEILGETQDDAAGEAFDKVAKMLGLPYPGGPEIALRASNFSAQGGPTLGWQFPRPMLNSNAFHFSFSGLKTAVLYFLKKHPEKMKDKKFIDAVCYEFQEAVVDVLVSKTKKALKLYSPKTLVIAGGVAANRRLREQLQKTINLLNVEKLPHQEKITFLTPEFAYSLDNAAMIGIAAAYRYERMDAKQKAALMHTPLTLDPNANLPLT